MAGSNGAPLTVCVAGQSRPRLQTFGSRRGARRPPSFIAPLGRTSPIAAQTARCIPSVVHSFSSVHRLGLILFVHSHTTAESKFVATANQLPRNCRLLRTLQPHLLLRSDPPWCEEDTQLPNSPEFHLHPCRLSHFAIDIRRRLQVHQ